MPRYIMGAVNMKISSRTRTTSTSGMMLISAMVVPMRRAPGDSSVLNAIFGGASDLGRAAQEVEEVEREAFHLHGPVLHAVDEVVVADDGGNRRAETHGRAARLAEDAKEFQRLAPNPPELPRLLHDERPAHDREDQEHHEDELRDRTRVPDERENAGTEWVSRHRRSLMFALSASQAL